MKCIRNDTDCEAHKKGDCFAHIIAFEACEYSFLKEMRKKVLIKEKKQLAYKEFMKRIDKAWNKTYKKVRKFAMILVEIAESEEWKELIKTLKEYKEETEDED